MPYQNPPDDPQEWKKAQVSRSLSNRAIRQLLILDLIVIAMVVYLTVAEIFFAPGQASLIECHTTKPIILRPIIWLFSKCDEPAPLLTRLAIWLRFMFPSAVILACIFSLLHTGRNFLMVLFHPSSSKKEVGRRVWNRLWGLHQLFHRRYVTVASTEMDPPDHWSKWLGGPAQVVVYDGFAAYLEYGNRFQDVIGAEVPVRPLDPRETIKTIVDLRPQFREFEVNGWTKDGIKVILGVRVESRIGSNYSPKKADPNLLYPFDPRSVRRAVEYTAVRAGDGKLVEADWCEGVTGRIKGLLAHYISSRRLDELYLIDRGDRQILSTEVLKQLLEEANNDLQNAGVHVSNIQITKTQIPEDVYGQRLDVWKAGKDSVVTRIQGEAHANAIRIGEEARARAQRDLIVSITRSLEMIAPSQFPKATLLSLSKVLDRGLKDPSVRANMGKETLLLLENLNNILP
jgi:hypothetical protein